MTAVIECLLWSSLGWGSWLYAYTGKVTSSFHSAVVNATRSIVSWGYWHANKLWHAVADANYCSYSVSSVRITDYYAPDDKFVGGNSHIHLEFQVWCSKYILLANLKQMIEFFERGSSAYSPRHLGRPDRSVNHLTVSPSRNMRLYSIQCIRIHGLLCSTNVIFVQYSVVHHRKDECIGPALCESFWSTGIVISRYCTCKAWSFRANRRLVA